MLGCTELSVLNEAFPLPQLPIIDAQAVLVEDTVSRAKASAARVGAGEKVGRAEQQPHPRMHGHPQSAYGRLPPPASGSAIGNPPAGGRWRAAPEGGLRCGVSG